MNSAYPTGRRLLWAAVGNPSIVQRSLDEMVSAMGSGASANPVAAAVAGKAVAQSDADQPLGRLADWLLDQGKSSFVGGGVANAFGFEYADIPARGKVYHQKNDNLPSGEELLSTVLVSTQNVHVDIFMGHNKKIGDPGNVGSGPMWLTSPSGILRATVYYDGRTAMRVPNELYSAEFESRKAYFLTKVPQATVGMADTDEISDRRLD